MGLTSRWPVVRARVALRGRVETSPFSGRRRSSCFWFRHCCRPPDSIEVPRRSRRGPPERPRLAGAEEIACTMKRTAAPQSAIRRWRRSWTPSRHGCKQRPPPSRPYVSRLFVCSRQPRVALCRRRWRSMVWPVGASVITRERCGKMPHWPCRCPGLCRRPRFLPGCRLVLAGPGPPLIAARHHPRPGPVRRTPLPPKALRSHRHQAQHARHPHRRKRPGHR